MKVLYPSERREIEPILKLFNAKIVMVIDEYGRCIYGNNTGSKEILFKNC